MLLRSGAARAAADGERTAANPTLTIVALAIRQAEYIAEQMHRKAL